MADNTSPTPFSLSWFASKDDLIAAQAARITELEAELEAVGAGGVQALRSPLKTAEGVEPTKDDEERAFESWLERTCPSGDCEAMQRQWEGSADFKDLFTAPQPQVEPAGAKWSRPAWLEELPAERASYEAFCEEYRNTTAPKNFDAAWDAWQARAALATTQPAVMPTGWVPCTITYEGQHPEEVAYGPQIMMDRLKKWLDRYFELRAQPAPAGEYPALPGPATWLVVRGAFRASPDGQDAESNEWLEEAHEPGEKGSFAVYTEQQLKAFADATHAMRAGEQEPVFDYPHEQMDALALARYKVVPSDQSTYWRHAVVAGDGQQHLYSGSEVDCQNMARKFAGAFLDGAFAFHSRYTSPVATQGEQDAIKARRYDYLRDDDRYFECEDDEAIYVRQIGITGGVMTSSSVLSGDDLDEAIDAALSDTTPPVAKEG